MYVKYITYDPFKFPQSIEPIKSKTNSLWFNLTIGRNVSGAPLTEAMYSVSTDPGDVWPAITDIRLRALVKWKRWKIFNPCVRPFRGTTASPFVRFHSTALRVAFSSGSPTRSSSICASEWQVARTCTVSMGASCTEHISWPLNGTKIHT